MILGKQRYCSTGGYVKGKDNSIIMDTGRMLERWLEYIEELFDENREGTPEIHRAIDGPPIVPFEVRTAIKKMKRNRTPGPGGIATELIKPLDDFGIIKNHRISKSNI